VLLPHALLRLEGLVVSAGALIVYFHADYNVWLFLALILAPDLSMAAYAAGPRIGALGYNALHTLVGPLVVGTVGIVADWKLGLEIALIWLAHIGIDRLMGYGLKYPTAFKDTHLQRV
jgi:hypothetical protein